MRDLRQAIELLKRKCKVVPEKYAMYNGAFLFLAYPSTTRDKSKVINPFYLVDLRYNAAGPASPAFDLEGFSKVAGMFKPCSQRK